MKKFKKKHAFFMLTVWAAWGFVFLVICPDLFSALQKISTKVTVYSDIFLTETGLLPLPENAIELEHEFSIQSIHFQVPKKIASDSLGNLYVSDKAKCSIFKFDTTGEFLQQIGEEGRKKGCFLSPLKILASSVLIIQDVEKKSLEYMDFQGEYIKSQKISDFSDIVSDGNNRFYVTPHVQDKKSPLVKVYSADGKILDSFGQPLSFHHSMQILNTRTLALNSKGELYVAFTYFPFVRKYSSDGELLAEFRVENYITEAKENFNLKRIGEGIANSIRRFGYMEVTVDIEVFKDKIYLMSDYPRLEILVMGEDGKINNTFWKEYQEVHEADDFFVQELEGKVKFYVLHSYLSNYNVDVFGINKDTIKNWEKIKEGI